MKLQALLARHALRRSLGGSLGVLLVLALGLGAAFTAVEAADRTDTAYEDHLRRADVADVVINPVIPNARTEELLAATPGVENVVSDSLLTAAPLGPDGEPLVESTAFTQFRVSQDGRYVDQDRPAVHEGRMVRSGREAFLSPAAADALDAEVGEDLDVGFFGVNEADPTGIEPGPMVGRSTVRVVGIGSFADDVLPDELYPRQYALITPEAAGDADCLQDVPDPEDTRTPDQLLIGLVPDGCAMTYRYYSLQVEGGRDRANAVVAELGERFRAENRNLPASLRQADIGYDLIPSFTADDVRSVRQAVAPVVTALRAFAALAATAAVGAALVLVVRQQRRRSEDLATWRALGMTRSGRAVSIGVLPILAVALGVLTALGVALVASPVGPVASARSVEPDPGPGFGSVALLAALTTFVLAAVAIAVASGIVARDPRGSSAARRRRAAWTAGTPFVALGLRAALRGRDAVTAAVGTGAAVAATVATLLFAVSVDRVVETPVRYGWGFDLAYLGNYGYGPVDLDAVAADLDHPDVVRWGAAVVAGNVTVEGENVPSLVGRTGYEEVGATTPVVDGRLPVGPDELAMGALTARDLDVDLGDEVTVGSFFGEHAAEVVGLVVLPDIGPFQSDRTSLGTGVLLPGALLEASYGDAESFTGRSAAELADDQISAVMVDLADGVEPEELLADLGDRVDAWDPSGFGVTYPTPVRPPAVIDLAAVRQVPAILAGLFVAAMVAAVVAGLAAGTRARRRELAVVRALGATRGQRRASVRIHAVTTVAIGLVVGLPVGVALGRLSFRRFAVDMGVVDDVAPALGLGVAVVAVAVLVAVVAAEVLARRAVARRPVPVEVGVGATGPRGSR